VLFSRTLLLELVVPWLDLLALWRLYQSCRAWRAMLCAHPEIAVFRAARAQHHGQIHKPLLAALKLRGAHVASEYWRCLQYARRPGSSPRDCHRVERWLRTHVHDTSGQALARRHRNNEYPYMDACRVLKRGDMAAYLEWSAAAAFQAEAQPFSVRELLCQAALRGGLPAYALETIFPDSLEEEPHYSLLCAWSSKHNTRSVEYLLLHHPRILRGIVQSMRFAQYATLVSLQWTLSYAQRERLVLDYERIYCDIMIFLELDDCSADQEARRMLKWLRPLALRAFMRRNGVEPLFPAHVGDRAEICFAAGLWNWPDLRDHWHYAYQHPANRM